MIVWSRWGFLVLLLVGVGILVGFGLSSIFYPGADSGPQVGLFVGIGFMVAGLLTWLLDRHVLQTRLDRPRQVILQQQTAPYVASDGRTYTYREVPAVNPETGEPIVVQPQSTFFWIPVRFWAWILPIGGLALVISQAIQLAR